MTKSKALSKKTSSISCGPWASSSWALACSSGQASAAPPSQQHAEKSIEIYSVRSVVRKPLVGSGKCEFIAPHSVEAWISNDENVANQHRNRRRTDDRARSHVDPSSLAMESTALATGKSRKSGNQRQSANEEMRVVGNRPIRRWIKPIDWIWTEHRAKLPPSEQLYPPIAFKQIEKDSRCLSSRRRKSTIPLHQKPCISVSCWQKALHLL